LHNPIINVVLKDFEKPYFIAGGQVAHPGKFDLRDDTTLTEAIAIAGGFTGKAVVIVVGLCILLGGTWFLFTKRNSSAAAAKKSNSREIP
jgi:hypothetical protein